MKRALLGLLVVCVSLGFASVTMAGENANAGISLHLTKPTTKAAICSAFNWRVGNVDPFKTKGQPCAHGMGQWDIWVVVCNGSDSVGVAGVEFGIEYDGASGSGVDIQSWRRCADLEFDQAGWPESGTGNLLTWEPSLNCQMTNLIPTQAKTAYAVVGVFSATIFGQDQMGITPRPASGRMKVADCGAVEDDLTDALVARGGFATFCTNRQGYNYCKGTVLGTESTTWGKIKAKYGEN